jgi:hypothetical protein
VTAVSRKRDNGGYWPISSIPRWIDRSYRRSTGRSRDIGRQPNRHLRRMKAPLLSPNEGHACQLAHVQKWYTRLTQNQVGKHRAGSSPAKGHQLRNRR